MTRYQQLPTTLLVLVTTALVALGVVWWVDSAPEPLSAAPAGPASNVVVIQLDDGAVLTYDTGRSGFFSYASQQVSGLERIVSTQWPCRIGQPGGRGPSGGGLDLLTQDSPRVISLPRCAGTSALSK
jgi:hypothetical protein